MSNALRFFILCLLCFPAILRGQSSYVSGIETKESFVKKHPHDRPVNFGIKGGFTSSLFLVSNLTLNDVTINEVQNNYKIGYFGSLFMRINFDRHFLQPEISYNINRCNITFERPTADDVPMEMSSITSSIHSIDIPVIYGYSVVKETPYGLAVFGGPKLRYIWNKKSKLTFENFEQQDIAEELRPLNISFTLGVAVTISRIFFDFRYDIGLHNISRKVIYDYTRYEENSSTNKIRFHRRDNVLSCSLGIFF
ncbi:porin family protein [uncultured Bacteroides sp.]|uniref:porin family protein n=1 Tax=uncultured Bacteroides sp. TaxID=162156 RepID=UPI00263991CE|nr:porin family protein [uncultured Bacteroides sp.]